MKAKRKKVGRPRFHKEKMKKMSISLTTEMANAIREIGGGKLSKGVRRLLNWYMGATGDKEDE